MPQFKVKCLDALYSITDGNLNLKVFVEELNGIRVIMMNKSDFVCSAADMDAEMEKTGQMFIGKTFNWQFNDSPDTKKLSDINELELAHQFKNNIAQTLDHVVEGMKDDDAQIRRYVSKIVNDSDKHIDGLIEEQLNLAKKREGK